MGATFSTIQIRNPHQVNPGEFKKSLCGYFEKKGFVPATEDDAEFSYWIALSEDSSWVTMGSGGYSLGAVHADVPEIANELQTHCILTSVVDSDFCELHLYCPDGQKDTISAGQVYCEEMYAESNPTLWVPLLNEGKTWEQLLKVSGNDHTFAEDALCEIAPLLGMNAKQVTNAFSCSEEVGADRQDVMDLYFKKAHQTVGKKATSLNTVFKQVFGEALEPLGFVKIKGRQPYFARLVGDELIHVVTYMVNTPLYPEWKLIGILGGVATVYRQRINLDLKPQDNINWLRVVPYIGSTQYESDCHIGKYLHSSHYAFKHDDDEFMLCEIKRALEATKQSILPRLDEVKTIEACIEYFYMFHSSMLALCDAKNLDKMTSMWNEGLLLIKTNYHDDGIERMNRVFKEMAQHMKEGRIGTTQKEFEEMYERYNNGRLNQLRIRDEYFNNPELHEKALTELERHKAANIEMLRSYGLNIQT